MSTQPAARRKTLTLALILTISLVNPLCSSSGLAQVSPKVSGELLASGNVTLNGTTAVPGVTVFGGSRVKTARDGSAIINLGKYGRIELGPDSELTLRLSEAMIGGTLISGQASVNAPAGVGISVSTAHGVAVSDGKEPSGIKVDLTRGQTRVTSTRGGARISGGSRVESLSPGQEISFGASPAVQAPAPVGSNVGAGGAAAFGGLSTKALTILIVAGVAGALGGVTLAAMGDEEDRAVSPVRP